MKIKSLYKLILMIALVGISLSTRAQDFGDEGGGDDGSGQVSTDPGDQDPDPGNVDPNNPPTTDPSTPPSAPEQGCCPGNCCPPGTPGPDDQPPKVDNPSTSETYNVTNPDGTVSTWTWDPVFGWFRASRSDPPDGTMPGSGTNPGGTGTGTGTGQNNTGTPPNSGVVQNPDGSYSVTYPDGTVVTLHPDGSISVSGGQGTCDDCSESDAEDDIPPDEQPPVLPPNPTPGQIDAYNQALQLYLAAQAAHGPAGPPPPPANPTNPCAYYIPSTASQSDRIDDLNTVLGTETNPFALDFIPSNTPPDLAQDWKNLATFTISADKVAKLNNLVGVIATVTDPIAGSVVTTKDVAHVQSINDAYSSVVNMDYFPVNITRLPSPNGGPQWSALNLLQYLRTNINNFINTAYSSFAPYNYYGVNDGPLWYSMNPDGAIVSITIPGDNGSVITTFPFLANNWTFTTIHDPYNGDHPVSGNRQFGFNLNADGSYTFYTKGVDRLTGVLGTMLQSTTGIPFKDADALWTSFQQGLVAFINANGGAATIVPPTKNRPNWDLVQRVLNGTVPPCAIAPH